jgi:hypothetical protein
LIQHALVVRHLVYARAALAAKVLLLSLKGLHDGQPVDDQSTQITPLD